MQRTASLPLAVLLMLALTSNASAQAPWTQPPQEADQVTLEAYRPSEPPDYYSQLSSFYFLSGRISLTDRLQATAELPFGYGRMTEQPVVFGMPDRPLPSQGLALGNPYLGAIWSASGQLDIEVGGRLPIAGFTAGSGIGGWGTTTRAAAFRYRTVVPIQALARYTHDLGRGFSLALRGGPEVLFSTEEQIPNDWALQYGVQGWYETHRFAVGAGLHGRWPDGWLNHEANVSLIGKFGRFRPGLVLRHQISDGFVNERHTVLGLSLGVTLPSIR